MPLNAVKPALKWAGGKRWLVPTLLEFWQSHAHRRLVEPFVGSMAVTLGLQPSRALLSDANIHLINFYVWLQRGLQVEIAMKNERESYYQFRSQFNQLALSEGAQTSKSAQIFYYLNRTGYNGLCRFNSKGEFNGPFGSYKVINYVRDFSDYQPALTRCAFMAGDFCSLPIEAGDFIYADPPYDVQFTRYSKNNFAWEDQVRLAEWLARHRGPVLLSNQATERVLELYERLGFKTKMLDGPRRISCTGDRTPAREVLAYRGM